MVKWIPHISDSPEDGEWEVSVILSDNDHGQQSWGWGGEDKIIICVYHEDNEPTKNRIRRWKKLHQEHLKIAQIVADSLNKNKIKNLPGGQWVTD